MSALARLHNVKFNLNSYRNTSNLLQSSLRTIVTQPVRCRSSKTTEDDEINKPLPFSQSKAASWSASSSFSGKKHHDSPWYQPIVISLSLSAILIWFCILREENDVDSKFSRSLYDQVKGLEKVQIELCLKYNKEHGLDTTALQNRLNEINRQAEK